jgi:hypothetical protein
MARDTNLRQQARIRRRLISERRKLEAARKWLEEEKAWVEREVASCNRGFWATLWETFR